jgi:hypothetical protein
MLKVIILVLLLQFSPLGAQVPKVGSRFIPQYHLRSNKNLRIINSTKNGEYIVYKIEITTPICSDIIYVRAHFKTHLITDLGH